MRSAKHVVFVSVLWWAAVCQGTTTSSVVDGQDSVQVYQVNRKVADFPEQEDLSTPEAAYATINRLSASGDRGFWRRVSAKALAVRMPAAEGRQDVSRSARREWLNTEVLEVRIYEKRYAGVIARAPGLWRTVIDYRCFELEEGQWKNAGNSSLEAIEDARIHFAECCARYVQQRPRPRVDDPNAVLRPYVEFLQHRGMDPGTMVLNALRDHQVVIMGEVHHRPAYWAFNGALVKNPEFPKVAGTVYLELPANDQSLVDQFLAGERCDKELVIEVLRDMLWLGWPDQPMLDFFVTLWTVNRSLPPEQKIRVVLVDMERPWEKIRKQGDWRRYNVDRDEYMAGNIVRDIARSGGAGRHALFIVGVGHAGVNFSLPGRYPHRTAGWHLREQLGEDKVYAILQHRCCMTNSGQVKGRVCLGLLDSALAACGNRPVAFPLEEGPFGEQIYDAQPDRPTTCRFRDGFHACLFLEPLEAESFAPLIQGFYSEEFLREIDRRHRIMYGKTWKEAYGKQDMSPDTFTSWMATTWGRPRKWTGELGPVDAWKYGDDWEQVVRQERHRWAVKHPEVIKAAAETLFTAIRDADYQRHRGGRDWSHFLPADLDYIVDHGFDSWVKWVCETFSANPIVRVELGSVVMTSDGCPAVSFKLVLRDGKQLEGTLPFQYLASKQCWVGFRGLDWHLQQQ